MVFIYGLKCPIAGVIRYVGKSTNPTKRLSAHLSGASTRAYDHHTARWLRKLAASGHSPEVEILCEVSPDQDWRKVEREFIASANERGWKLTNTTAGGEGLDYLDPADAARYRANLSRAMKRSKKSRDSAKRAGLARWAKPDAKEKFRETMRAAWSDPERRSRMAAALAEVGSRPEVRAVQVAALQAARVARQNSGRPYHSKETRAAMAAAKVAAWSDPEKRARLMAVYQSPERREKIRQAALRRATPEYRAIMAEKKRLWWQQQRGKT